MRATLFVCLVAASLLTGCPSGPADPAKRRPTTGGGSDAGAETEPESSPAATGTPWDPAKATATIKGVVKFGKENAPKRRPLPMSSDQYCHDTHGGKEILDESVVLNDDKTVRNAFVYVKKGVEGFTFPVPKTPVVLDQVGCTYVPHVVSAQKGQVVQFKNSDGTAHNVHVFTDPPFNTSQKQGGVDTMTIDTTELPIKVKCDIHSWMSAYICAVKHPFHAVTGDGGTFELGKLAPGDYVVGLWHERLGERELKVTVADGEVKAIELVLD